MSRKPTSNVHTRSVTNIAFLSSLNHVTFTLCGVSLRDWRTLTKNTKSSEQREKNEKVPFDCHDKECKGVFRVLLLHLLRRCWASYPYYFFLPENSVPRCVFYISKGEPTCYAVMISWRFFEINGAENA